MIEKRGSVGGLRPEQVRQVRFVDGRVEFGDWEEVHWLDEEEGDERAF